MTPLKKTLDSLYRNFDFKGRVEHDPIRFPKRYIKKEDIEVSAFMASAFAYGKVELFTAVLEKMLSVMGRSPHEFLVNFDSKSIRLFRGISYRFQKEDDITAFLNVLSLVLRRGGMEGAFMKFYGKGDPNTARALTGFMAYLRGLSTCKTDGFYHLLPAGGALKRVNLFLRWMVRDKDIDFGIWRGIPKGKLIIPLDVHVGDVSRCLGLTRRRSNDLKTAIEITDALRKLDPEDPLKYDFPMCHSGMLK